MVFLPVIAQVSIPFQHWPALWDAAENAVVKRGTNLEHTNDNGYLYFRIGWGECLVVHVSELETLHGDVPHDRYINFRQYAEAQLQSDQWNEEHEYNCPKAPLEVKPYYRGSRPTYYRVLSEDETQYVRGRKSPYRVSATDPLPGCRHYGVADSKNYWVVNADTVLHYSDDKTMLASDIEPQYLVAVCRDQDDSIEDLRF